MDYRVLIVEGETTAVWMVKQKLALDRRDLEFESFVDPQKVLESLKQRRPDLLITDVKMLKISSAELLREARSIVPDLPVLIVTSCVDPALRAQMEQAGVVGYFEKPIDLDKFLETINRLLPTQKTTNWQELLAESSYRLEAGSRSNWEAFDSSARRTGGGAPNLFDSPSRRVGGTAANLFDAPSRRGLAPAVVTVPAPAARSNSAAENGPTSAQAGVTAHSSGPSALPAPVAVSPQVQPAAPPLPGSLVERLKILGRELCHQINGSLACAVVDLQNREMVACHAEEHRATVNGAALAQSAISLFRADSITTAPLAELMQVPVEEAGPQEIQMVFPDKVLFGKTAQQGRLAAVVLTEREVNIGYGWVHLKAALAALEA